MTIEELEQKIKKNTKLRKVSICDMFEGFTKDDPEDMEFLVDTYSENQSRAKKIADYLNSLGYETEIVDGTEMLPTDDDHEEWLMVHADNFNRRK